MAMQIKRRRSPLSKDLPGNLNSYLDRNEWHLSGKIVYFCCKEQNGMAERKFYTVWRGVNPGVYDSWRECEAQTKGFGGARYKSFPSRELAEQALTDGYEAYLKSASSPQATKRMLSSERTDRPSQCLAVDAACSGNPGDMEYRGVLLPSGEQLFHVGPMRQGTNNIGEFLAIVHALALLQQKGIPSLPVYSDSRNAISWIKKKKCRTLLVQNVLNRPIFDLIERAERWLNTHEYLNEVRKWNTDEWGEIPADFGRK
jgi:ribonuclease HI